MRRSKFRFAGKAQVGAREYDPRTARWLQRDPIEASSGDPNFWRYCGNDPLNSVDPSGLDLLDDAANFFAGWGDRLTALPDWLGGDSLTQHVRRFLGVDEIVDPCSEAYLRGDLVGTVHDFLLTRGRGGGVRQGFAQGGKKAGRRANDSLQQKVVDINISKKKNPQAARHIEDAQNSGYPSELTLLRSGAGTRRRESTGAYPRKAGYDRDEYPPAVTSEGGSGASVRHINPKDNRSAGAQLGHAIRNLPDGTRIRIRIVP